MSSNSTEIELNKAKFEKYHDLRARFEQLKRTRFNATGNDIYHHTPRFSLLQANHTEIHNKLIERMKLKMELQNSSTYKGMHSYLSGFHNLNVSEFHRGRNISG